MTKGLTYATETITPQIAEQMLEANTKNRKLSSLAVTRLATDMKEGRWQFDGTPIRFDTEGNLIDGQHRLWAVVESETTQEFIVVRNVAEEAMATLDTGRKRSFADVLSLNHPGLANVSAVAAAVNMIYKWEDGRRGTRLRASGSQNLVPYATMLAFFEANMDEIITAARRGATIVGKTGIGVSVMSTAIWAFSKIDADDADEFFTRFHDGVGLDAGNPILTLRNWAEKHFFIKPHHPPEVQMAYLIKAWNAWRDGDELTMMVWKRGGAKPEAFPTPH